MFRLSHPFIAVLLISLAGQALAAPSWWTQYGVLNGNPASDYAAVNQGQAKWIASRARLYFNATLPGGAGAEIDNLIASWEIVKTATGDAQGGTQDYAVLLNGQAKNLAKPFYDRLAAVGLRTAGVYPWSGTAKDYSPANIGILKQLFDFDADIPSSYNTDSDQLPNSWETTHFGNLSQNGSGDFDGDGVSNAAEFTAGTSPTDYYNGVAPTLTITGGQNQISGPGVMLPQALQVRVTGALSVPKVNAPVTFSVVGGTNLLVPYTNGLGTAVSQVILRTDADGYVSNPAASVFINQPSQTGVVSKVTATAGSASGEFKATTSGIVSRWNFDEGTGSAVADVVGANEATLSGPAWVSGIVETAIQFNGTDQDVFVSESPSGSLSFEGESFSISAWFNTTSTSGIRRIISKGHYGWTNGYFISVGHISAGKVCFGIGAGGSTPNGLLFGTNNVFNDGDWHHVAVSVNHSTSRVRIYVDGVQQAITKDAGTGGTVVGNEMDYSALTSLSASTSNPFTIGSYAGVAEYFDGTIEDVRVFRQALTQSEVTELYNTDTDLDGASDWLEAETGTDSTDADTDNDTMPDGFEIIHGLDWSTDDRNSDLDGDGVVNRQDARPNNNSVGVMQISITTPANGSTL